ncbi:hypothetical protein FOZ62_026321 [Perkinsus olseni]|uniref:Uncharacterized protein n=1 Tax=Perkinsus olseni TaxID=32597 RepID=A0A7J6Q755_PEROL|nr:hypothetical protein FOZ62_026321 [Perkinsus olseni]
MSVHMGHRELTTCLLGFAKIRYRDPKLLQSISPAILKSISEFDTLELALLLGAYRRLEYRRIDQIELLMNENPQLRWSSEPFLVGLVLHGMAKVDLRHSGSLKTLSRAFTHHCRRYAELQRQETLAVGLNALARLDWRSRKMRLYAEQAVAARLQRALQLDNVSDRTKGRDNDTFDMQSLSLLVQSLVSLADELPPTSLLMDLFSLASTSTMGVMARRLHTKEMIPHEKSFIVKNDISSHCNVIGVVVFRKDPGFDPRRRLFLVFSWKQSSPCRTTCSTPSI